MSDQQAGTLYIISAPSGAGKSSLLQALLARDTEIALSISHTTRPPRPGEENGVHYHFTDIATFEQMVAAGEFLEHAQVFGNYYGTSREALLAPLAAGRDVILEIDWQGARQVRMALPEAVTLFILPPSIAALESRLRGRGQDSDAVIAKRMAAALDEISHYPEFDYLIINDQFDTALAQLQTVLQARRLRRVAQQQRQQSLLAALGGVTA